MRVFYVATTRAEEELIIVDTINSLDDYRRPLDGWALLEGGSYTSWLLHTYLMCPNDLFVLDEVEEISERTEIKKRKNFRMGLQYYQGPVSLIESRTASRAKSDLRWKKVSLKENTRTVRGTLLHEIIGGSLIRSRKKTSGILRPESLRVSRPRISIRSWRSMTVRCLRHG